jgi:hypothetical protein
LRVFHELRSRWRPLRRRLQQRFGLGRHARAGLAGRLKAAETELASLLRRMHPAVDAAPRAQLTFRDHEARLHSQNGEDGLLLHIFSTIGVVDRRLVEIGIEDGRECLARTLLVWFGWSGLVMDSEGANVADARRFFRDECGFADGRVRVVRCFVTAENVDGVLVDNGMTGDVDLLSIDIDGNDYWVWKAITAIRPRVVAIEYNASFGPDEALTVPYDPGFDRKAKHPSGWYHGASIAALASLARRRGYALVGGDSSGVNAFFVRAELLGAALPEVSPAEAWRPHRSRTRRATADEQLALLRALPLVRDP